MSDKCIFLSVISNGCLAIDQFLTYSLGLSHIVVEKLSQLDICVALCRMKLLPVTIFW